MYLSVDRRTVGLALVYLVVSVATVMPNLQAVRSTLPIETDAVNTVPLFNAWTLWWNADRTQHQFHAYWKAPIFHPEADTFAFSEPQPITVVLTPVYWLSGSPILVYNFYLILSLCLNGLVTASIVRRRTSFWTGAAVGLWMLWLPVVHMNIGVLQLVPIWPSVWLWDSADRLMRQPSTGRGVMTGLAFATTWATCMHHGLFISLLLLLTGWVLIRTSHLSLRLRALGVALLIAGSLTAPLLLKIRGVMQEHEFVRSSKTVQRLTAHPQQYAYTPSHNPLSFVKTSAHTRRLSPGWTKVLLVIVGMAVSVWRCRWRRWNCFLLVTLGAAFLLSLGPNFRVGSFVPWEWIVNWIPGFAQVRSVYRFCYFVHLATVLLAAMGVWQLWVLRRHFCEGQTSQLLGGGIIFILIGCATLESWPQRPLLAGVPDAGANAQWLNFIREHTEPDRSVVCLPFSQGPTVEDYAVTARWMYFGTFHQQPLLNGYSGFFPESYQTLQDLVNDEFPSEAVFARFRSAGVQFVIVERSKYPPAELRPYLHGKPLELALSDPVGIDVYTLCPE